MATSSAVKCALKNGVAVLHITSPPVNALGAVRRGVPGFFVVSSLDSSIARTRHRRGVVSMSDPRRHVCLCAACAGAADACPMCRRPVEDVFRVFLS